LTLDFAAAAGQAEARRPPRGPDEHESTTDRRSAMREPSLDGLHARLERLERQVAWRRRPDEVKTRRLVITDGEGRGRAVLTVDESDRTRLSLADRDGATTADLTVTPGQSAALSVSRAGAQAQLAAAGDTGQLSVGARGQRGWLVAAPTGSSLALGNDPGKPQVTVATSPTQSPSLQLSDREGNAVWKAP
jgi:hypothetical protein